MTLAASGANWEVEVKFHHGDFGPLRELLGKLGGTCLGIGHEEDTYFRHPSRDFSQTGEALRIRTTTDSNAQNLKNPANEGGKDLKSPPPKKPSVLCYKGPRISGPAKVRREIETGVVGEEIRPLLEALGFVPVLALSKTRESWRLGKEGESCLICLDEAHGLGNFVEVEVVAKAAQRDEAQARVLELASRLGLGAREDRSYLRMQLEKCR